jgi:phenylalanyl-tRNA synthetase beta chain
MLVSWNWLKDYVALDMPVEQFEERLTLAGLNHEETVTSAGDVAIDLEVTSNRPDCLGHIGVAREVAVLFERELKIPQIALPHATGSVADTTSVAIECPELCSRYTARVIRGVKVGPSPAWLVDRLVATLSTKSTPYKSINNVADITNYVLLECGQPLHAFDFAKLRGGRIIVREARSGEKFEAIDHKTYELAPGMCVIADAERPVALGGVMGGADTEITDDTTDLLIESAEFDPLSIRNTARKLYLHSPSSYRFERRVDPEGVDWASRRCCQMILDLAGGELVEGVIDVGPPREPREPVVLRLGQLKRVLGIDVDSGEVRRILTALGCGETSTSTEKITTRPPTWRRDLTREIDLIEEVARIHGYDQIPEDVGVSMVASARSEADQVLDKVRTVLRAARLNEAMTLSATGEAEAATFSPWTDQPPLTAGTPVIKGADRLRRSVVPSLLHARRTNESLSNPRIELFETAQVYLAQPQGLPREELLVAWTTGGEYRAAKGIVEAVVAALNPEIEVEAVDVDLALLTTGRRAELLVDGERLGFLGEVSAAGLETFGLRNPTSVAELRMSTLMQVANLLPQHTPQSAYPPIHRDLNVVFNEEVRWADVARISQEHGGELLERVEYQDTYRDAERLGGERKSLLFRLTLRSTTETLTGEAADAVVHQVVAALQSQLAGELRA